MISGEPFVPGASAPSAPGRVRREVNTESWAQPPRGPDARAMVELALSFDRSSTRLVRVADLRVGSAQADFVACLESEQLPGRELPALTNALQIALGAQLFATEYQERCHHALMESLDRLSDADIRRPGPGPGSASYEPVAAAVVMAEATAIAAAAEASVLAEMHASAVLAARIAQDAVVAAAATVCQAAEQARRARAAADALAAHDIATAAISTATHVQRKAEELAAMVHAAAAAAVSQSPTPRSAEAAMAADRLAALVVSTANIKADETAAAAAIVADAVSQAAAAVAVITAATAAATATDVRDAALAVQATAASTAGELAAVGSRARHASPDSAMPRPESGPPPAATS